MTAVLRIWFLLVLIAAAARAESGLLQVWNVDSALFNALGGRYNSYGSDGCEVVLERTPLFQRGSSGHSLKITYRNANAASCGMWVHLFNEEDSPGSRAFPDMMRFPYVSFWILDGGNPEDVEVRMADPIWLARDDSKPAGSASTYLGPHGSDGWSEVVVPFRDFKLGDTRAAVLVLQFAPHTNGVLYADDFYLKGTAGLRPGYSGSADVSAAKRRRGMWLWQTARLLKDAVREQEAIATLREAKITDLFLQVPYRRVDHGGSTECALELEAGLRQFISKAHAAGIRVHALDGSPELALRSHHEPVLSFIRRIVAFNGTGAPNERFDGIHLDNEPYQLLGFSGSGREEILRQYLELNEKAGLLLRQEANGLEFGVDIPFWLDAAGDDGSPCCLVTFNGVRKSAGHHILDLVDNAGVMAYRDHSGGPDGIVEHGRGEVSYAGTLGKQVFVAVETFRPRPATATFVAAIEESKWQALPAGSLLEASSKLAGHPVRSFTAGQYRYIGVAGNDPGDETFADALRTLRLVLAELSSDWTTDLREFKANIERQGTSTGEWQRVSVVRLNDDGDARAFGLSVIESMPTKVTLAGKTREFVDEVLREVSCAFKLEPGFAGNAIHSLESYQELGRK